MDTLPSDWTGLATVVFLLGLKHGFDADHLATIDGLTRLNTRLRSPHARYCGALFSLGHGAVVMLIAVLVSLVTTHWQTPAWLEASGTWISIFFLTALGIVNVRAAVTAAPDELVPLVGIKSRWLGRLGEARSPWVVALVGALFALSFDTVSQAALFSLTAQQFGGLAPALMLGGLFTIGMLVTDGINGLWISRLIARADDLARVAARVMGLAVGGVSLLVAGFAVAKLTLPTVGAWAEGKEIFFGAAVAGVVLLSYLVGRRLALSGTPKST
ncbi:MAG: nickel transporter [Gammaproteobacteria bacterium]|jgi:high-affinity nickel-transport protein|nr:nickel transporter [Gammaproteobacteria bacterium]